MPPLFPGTGWTWSGSRQVTGKLWGHTDPMLVLPYGQATVDGVQQGIAVTY